MSEQFVQPQQNDGRQMTLIDQIVRNRVFSCRYWKEECFGLTAVTLVDKAINLDCVGTTYSGTGKPTAFLCLLLKLLQINPEKEIIIEFIKNKDYKYVNALAMFYLRMVGKPAEIYSIIELFYSDFRKLRVRNQCGLYSIIYMDEFAEQLLSEEILLGVSLPRMPKRWQLDTKQDQERVLWRQNQIKSQINLLFQKKMMRNLHFQEVVVQGRDHVARKSVQIETIDI